MRIADFLLAEYDDKSLEVTAETCLAAAEILRKGAEEVALVEPPEEPKLNAEALDHLQKILVAFDLSDNEQLKRTASVVDELLLTISAPEKEIQKLKTAKQDRIDTLKK